MELKEKINNVLLMIDKGLVLELEVAHSYVVGVSGGAHDLSKVVGHVLLLGHPSENFGPSRLGAIVRSEAELNHKGNEKVGLVMLKLAPPISPWRVNTVYESLLGHGF